MPVLRHAHAVVRDHRLGRHIDACRLVQGAPFKAGSLFDGVPGLGAAERGEILKARRMLPDEVDVDDSRSALGDGAIVSFDHVFTDSDDGRGVTTDADLMILRADPRAACDHLDRILRIGEAFEAALAQGVERDDGNAALRRLLKRVQHAWRIGRRVVAEEENAIGVIEILQQNRADRRADHLRQSDRSGLVAHVRAVGKIAGPVHPAEQLIHVARFERSAARRVHHNVMRIELVQFRSNLAESFIPCYRQVFVAAVVIAHRRRQTSLLLQLVVRPGAQLGQGVLREELRRDCLSRYFPGRRLGAIFTELERMRFCRLGP